MGVTKMVKRLFQNARRLYSRVIAYKELINSKCLPAMRILRNEFALEKSMYDQVPVDKYGSPIPWYTYPAIEYLKQLDFTNKRVFEFGSGNSSLFWAENAQSVISIEENEAWYNSSSKNGRPNLIVKLKKAKDEYCESITEEEGLFDIVIIDGNHDRSKCAENAIKKLASDGMIILDNSDRCSEFEEYSNAIQILRQAGLIQIDFLGFGPVNNFTWGTTLFLSRSFNFKSVNEFQPAKSIGTIKERLGLEKCKKIKNTAYIEFEKHCLVLKKRILSEKSLKNFRYVNQINIQINNQCNYALAHKECPVHHNVNIEVMETKTIHKILNELAEINYQGIVMFSLYNEPMGDERFFELCSYTKQTCRSAKILVNTNGAYLNNQNIDNVKKVGVDCIFISTYSVKEYERFLKLETTLPVCICPVILDDRLDIYTREYRPCKVPCHAPFSDLSINSKGDLVLCCLDWNSKYVFGNVHTNTLSEIINTKEITDIYKKLAHGKRELDICKRCTMYR